MSPKKNLKIGLTSKEVFILPISDEAMPSMISMISMISRLVHHDLPIVMAGCTAGRDDRGLQTWSEASCTSEAVGCRWAGPQGEPGDDDEGAPSWTMRENKNISWDLIRDYMCMCMCIYIFIYAYRCSWIVQVVVSYRNWTYLAHWVPIDMDLTSLDPQLILGRWTGIKPTEAPFCCYSRERLSAGFFQ